MWLLPAGDAAAVVQASGSASGKADAALVVAIAGACIALASLAWNLVLYRLSGARLQVRLFPVVLTTRGLMYGPDRGWRRRAPEGLGPENGEVYVDLAIIKVTNIGRSPVSVSDIVLDFGRTGWRPWWRQRVGGRPIAIQGCRDIDGDVRLDVGQSVSMAIDHEPLVESGIAYAKRSARVVRASATAAGRRPTRSAWRHRWSLSSPAKIYYPGERTPEQKAFAEVFRAVQLSDVGKLNEAWGAVAGLLLRDAAAGPKEISDELAKVLEVDPMATIDLVVPGIRIADLLPKELAIGTMTIKRGSWGQPG